MERNLEKVIERYIRNTPTKGFVKDLRIKIGDIPHKWKGKLKLKDTRVYITTRSLKHLYDVRKAQEFDFIVSNIDKLILSANGIYKDKEGKTGNFCFYVEIKNRSYFCIVEVGSDANYLISAYRLSPVEVKRRNYLARYKLIWSWKVDLPSS